jgi:hypothetical protein
MARWSEIVSETPEFAAAVQARFDAHRHKTLATLRADGSPRISGIEAGFVDGDLWLGMMPDSRKALDLRRDPRLALHSGSPDPSGENPSEWVGDAKLAGRAVEITDPKEANAVMRRLNPPPEGAPDDAESPTVGGHIFYVDITEMVLNRIGDPPDHMLIQMWHEGRGLRTVKRA